MRDIEKRKRGRPAVDGSMRNQYRLMMSDDMTRRLDNLSKITGKSKADIFREAFDRFENDALAGHDYGIYEDGEEEF